QLVSADLCSETPMAWQKRIYCARSVRRGDRVISHYVGGVTVGARAEAYDRCTRAARVDLLTQCNAECARLELLEQPLETFSTVLDVLVRATLVAHGYRQHARGQWRKKRHGTPQTA